MSTPVAPSQASAIVRPDWPAPAGVQAFATTRCLPGLSQPPYDAFNLGTRSGEDPATVAANRALLQRSFALPAAPRWLHQVHGDRSLRITEEIVAGDPEADAAFTRQSRAVLAILSADCLPLLVCARDGREVAAIHAGWRGLAAGVIENCLRRLATDPADLLAWIGPAIGAASYEVGVEVREAFVQPDAGAADAFAPTRPGHWRCDLPRLARRRLAARGVENVYGGDFDTFSDARFYSYRRDGARSGRFASLIWIDR